MPPPDPRSGDLWSLTPPTGRVDEPAPLVVLDRRCTDGRWHVWPVFDTGLLAVEPDIRLPGDTAAPFGEAWCAPAAALDISSAALGHRVDALPPGLIERMRAAETGTAQGDARRRAWPEVGDPRPAAREALFAPHRAHRGPAHRPRRGAVAGLTAIGLAAAAALLVTRPSPDESGGPPTASSTIRSKGGLLVTLDLVRAGGIHPLSAGARPGDVLRITYSTHRTRLSVLRPARAAEDFEALIDDRAITPGNGLRLPDGILLNDPATTLWFVFSDRPVDIDDIRRVRAGRPPPDIEWQIVEVAP